MDSFSRTTVVTLILVISNIIYDISVDGQWCTGTGAATQSFVASTSSVGEITSRNYPSHYINNLDCTSYITTSGTNQVVFYVEYEHCEFRFDHLKIYSDNVSSSNQLYNSDYYSAPHVYVTTGDTLVATFVTDYSITYGGFKMSYIAVDRTNLPNCGTSITATSSYQQLSYVYLSSQSSSCTWAITTADTTGTYAVQIEILMVQGSVEIEESGSSNYYYTKDSIYVSGPYPSSVQVTGLDGNDFVVQYKQVLSTVTGVIITTTVASDISVCGSSYRTSTNSTQYLTSPDYPAEYQSDLSCTVTIDTGNNNQAVFVNISDYAVATDDVLKIYDGPSVSYNLISSGIGIGANYTSTASTLTLLFYTNNYGRNRGFQLTYYNVNSDTPVCVQNYTLEANVTSSAVEDTLQSPNYPSYYSNNDDRYWLIVKPSETDNIVLDFRVFSVEFATDCVFDYVSIYDGACTTDPLLAKVCGVQPVTFEDSTGLYILVHFHTDLSVVKTGWALTHYIGDYQDPDADAATEESKTGIKDFIYPIVAIAVIAIIATTIFIFLYYKGKGRVGVGDAKAPLKKRTTSDLLDELKTRYGSKETDKQPKIKRKGNRYHPKPNPPGPDTTVINIREQGPHPPPGQTDPAHPPAFLGMGTQMPGQNVAPALTHSPDTKPPAPVPKPAPNHEPAPVQGGPVSSLIPPPFPYKTPAEARAAGLHG